MEQIHGGDIYTNKVRLDFSVNINPLGMPKQVRRALHDAVKECGNYPDMEAFGLKERVAKQLSLPREYLLFGNGASEIFMGIVHALQPGRVVLPVPSFYGYEYVTGMMGCEICYVPLKEEENFVPGKQLLESLKEGTDLVFIANPNNPTGQLADREYLIDFVGKCRDKGIYVVLDECFLPFCEEESMMGMVEAFPNLCIVRAFTKIYAIPGVRLGYLVCSDRELVQRIGRQLPEWNLSVFAQKAGIACMGRQDYLDKTRACVKTEREFLCKRLEQMGLRVFPGKANYLLFYSDKPLYDKLLKRGILIRNCKNFRGLSEGYYRIAVKNRRENEILVKEIGVCLAEN